MLFRRRRYLRREAILWSIATGLTLWLSFRLWRLAIRDQADIRERSIDGFTTIAAVAAVRRERLRMIGQLVSFLIGISSVIRPAPAPTSDQPRSFLSSIVPYGLILTQTVLMANALLDLYDRRRALATVIDVPGWRRGWKGIVSVLWTTEDDG